MKKSIDKKLINLLIAALIFVGIKLFLPAANGLTDKGVSVIGLFVATIYAWTTIGIDWVSFLVIILFACIGLMTPAQMYAASFGNWLIPFLIVALILNASLAESGFTKRIFNWFITRKVVIGRPWLFVCYFLFAVYVVSLFMDMVTVPLICFPMAEELFKQLGYEKGDKFPKIICLGILTCVPLGFAATPISHTIPIIIIGMIGVDFGVNISVLSWMAIGIPVTLIMFGILMLLIRFVLKPDVSKLVNFDIEKVKAEMKPMDKKEKMISGAFALVVLFWLLPDLGVSIIPKFAVFIRNLGLVAAPVIAISVLCVVKIKGETVIDFPKTLSKVNWSLIITVACMFVLSNGLTHSDAGIIVFLKNVFSPILSSSGGWMCLVIVTLWVVILTNFIADFVTITMVYSVVIPLIIALPQLGLNPIAMAILIGGFGCIGNFAPSASAAALIMMSTAWYTPKDAMKYNLPICIAAIIVCIFVCYPLANLILPYMP